MEIPKEAEQCIATHHLGTAKKIYTPNTVGSLLVGLIVIIFAVFWMMAALLLTGSPLLPVDATSTYPPVVFVSPDPSLTNTMTVLGVVLPLIGLILVGAGLVSIIKTVSNWQRRVVLCEHGVVDLTRERMDAFRWEQVATVLDKVEVHRHQIDSEQGRTSTPPSTSHSYKVVCADGRTFLFDETLSRVEQLGEEIQVAVALVQHARP
jgi:hypothetical protein